MTDCTSLSHRMLDLLEEYEAIVRYYRPETWAPEAEAIEKAMAATLARAQAKHGGANE